MKAEEILEALWQFGRRERVRESRQNYDIRPIQIGEVATRKFGGLFLVRVREGAELKVDFATLDKSEAQKIEESYRQKFEKEQKKVKQHLAEKRERELREKSTEFTTETEWGTLRVRVLVDHKEWPLRWTSENELAAITDKGDVRFPSVNVEEAPKRAAAVLFKRMNAGSESHDFLNEMPLVDTTPGACVYRRDRYVYGDLDPIFQIIVDMPAGALAIIAERRRRMRGE
jgi:hypothetical protein